MFDFFGKEPNADETAEWMRETLRGAAVYPPATSSRPCLRIARTLAPLRTPLKAGVMHVRLQHRAV
jgi:hypothetical protein